MSNQYQVQCDCAAVQLSMTGAPKVQAFCHCDDCRDLLQVPYHSVLAWDEKWVNITSGQEQVAEFQHPHKRMKRIFCKSCGEVLYNTNAMGWKLVSQLLLAKCNGGQLPAELASNAHFFYAKRNVDIEDGLPKRS
ncbi:MAG: GFA family protein [Oceanospirillaceae bacterium]|nr:GFA family protein [Oceanospirillaceae bacterium]